MNPTLLRRRAGLPGLVGGLLLAGVVLVPAAAQPPAKLPPGPAAVPADAAAFVHVNVEAVWNSAALKAVRAADPKTFTDLTAQAKAMFGVTPDQLKTATLFFPKVKEEADTRKMALVLTFAAPFDKTKLRDGVNKTVPPEAEAKVVTPNNTTAAVLFGLDEKWAAAQPADKAGPLADALRAAATGTHAVVFGATLDSLPDEIRRTENVPQFVRMFSAILKSDAVTGTLDFGKDFTLDLRVKAATPGQAAEAEKALGALRDLLKDGLSEGIKEAGQDAAFKEVTGMLTALETALKDAKFRTDKAEARATVSMSGDQPFAAAWTKGTAKVREAAAAARSANNLKQIALAMHGYADTNDSFPPAAVCDKTGKPMLSWRVLILPYVEQDQLYKQFKLDEPWDSDHNKKLIAKMPAVYALPDKAKPGDTTTHYRVFTGNGAGFDYLKGPKFADLRDGTSNTIMAVTAADAVPWTKPDELAFDREKDMSKLLGAVVNGRIQVAMFDGSVRTLAKVPMKKNLDNLIDRDDGQVVTFDD